ncbi:hypothetical protein M409DRAFT_54529 [Zasmidium cellare ATCC 36951]|uniref:Uncharacterized protein n=1 Tax=Zasmidium cellare ATCC 36951 TaxID=1080233 RepID=A0A6A6CKK3_ZASCE|nr:uncharacterized protein M409DRAFT_54529 [Zasmidium cellare ATCC 36951]KAF2166738.1 hypothetical protein M409DRAFT_54529 [Zasmidium cellare ATCC 36951]
MATPLLDHFPTYWRAMGLSVAATFAGLGSFAILAPKQSVELFGMKSTTPESAAVGANSMFLLGVRDLSSAAALAAFYYQENPNAMGTVIMSSMILCVADCMWMYKLRRDAAGPLLGVGAAIWAYIGVGLLKL